MHENRVEEIIRIQGRKIDSRSYDHIQLFIVVQFLLLVLDIPYIMNFISLGLIATIRRYFLRKFIHGVFSKIRAAMLFSEMDLGRVFFPHFCFTGLG